MLPLLCVEGILRPGRNPGGALHFSRAWFRHLEKEGGHQTRWAREALAAY